MDLIPTFNNKKKNIKNTSQKNYCHNYHILAAAPGVADGKNSNFRNFKFEDKE